MAKRYYYKKILNIREKSSSLNEHRMNHREIYTVGHFKVKK